MALDNPSFSIIECMYVKGEKYETALLQSGYSRQVFDKYRKRGLEGIILLYNSDQTIHQLNVVSKNSENERLVQLNIEQPGNSDYQMSMDDLFNDLEKENTNGK